MQQSELFAARPGKPTLSSQRDDELDMILGQMLDGQLSSVQAVLNGMNDQVSDDQVAMDTLRDDAMAVEGPVLDDTSGRHVATERITSEEDSPGPFACECTSQTLSGLCCIQYPRRHSPRTRRLGCRTTGNWSNVRRGLPKRQGTFQE